MDIYRKEIDEIYARQNLNDECCDDVEAAFWVEAMNKMAQISGMCCVLTNISKDTSHVAPSLIGEALDLTEKELAWRVLNSSDEDFLYDRIHPADLVDLRMLEYEFFTFIDKLPDDEKKIHKAVANVRMEGYDGKWLIISKSTQVVALSPKGKMWLILCTYDILNEDSAKEPRIINIVTGQIRHLSFSSKRDKLLTNREKELLILVRKGFLSKEISTILGISVNTVNRHRQNILEKLSVNNSMEAVNAALAMGLL